ncbi:MAG: hypothetical protein LBS18_01475, partial [Clostridiales bacterium]|nr:hypothetical protein [Clostridiales bacterium]
MKTKPRFRFIILGTLMLGMMGLLIWQLGNITLAEGDYYAEKAESRRTTTIYTTGARGRILDRNGIPLAYDETSFNVQFTRNPEKLSDADSAIYTETLMTAISIIEEGGGTTIDSCYIKQDEESPGSYRYDWGVTLADSQEARFRNFCLNMGLRMGNENDMSTWITADDAYKILRKSWHIPDEMPYEEAVKIMSIRQELNM